MTERSEWRPIETAPVATDEFGHSPYVLLYLPDHGGSPWVTMGSYFREEERDDRGRFKGGGWTGVDWDGLPSGDLKPTHWMPLPEAPPPPKGSIKFEQWRDIPSVGH